jgi:hypothetical protein
MKVLNALYMNARLEYSDFRLIEQCKFVICCVDQCCGSELIFSDSDQKFFF